MHGGGGKSGDPRHEVRVGVEDAVQIVRNGIDNAVEPLLRGPIFTAIRVKGEGEQVFQQLFGFRIVVELHDLGVVGLGLGQCS